jgi:LPS-assembly lipoprotein
MMLRISAGIKPRADHCGFAGRRALRIALAAVAWLGWSSLIAGCGFGLAGAVSMPSAMRTLQLATTRPHSEFAATLRETLAINGIELVAERSEADLVLHILEDSTGQRILSVSARNVPREFEVFYAVSFALEIAEGEPSQPQVLVASRNYSYDVNQVLGKSAEEQALRRTLAADLARRVIRRIETTVAGGPSGFVELPPPGI